MTTVEGDTGATTVIGVRGEASLPGVEAPRRGPVFGSRFATATDHPLASLVAMNIMQHGGNAADAVIAASAVNVVTKPQRTHLGGDAFMLVWRRKQNTVECLNAGGRAPLKSRPDLFPKGIPALGALASTIPGLVDAWFELHSTYATLPLEVLLKPAIELAENGFPVTMSLSEAMTTLEGRSGEQDAMLQTFLVDGRRAYRPGEILRQHDLAETLKRIVEEGDRDGFYAGKTAELIAKAYRDTDGIIDEGDFAKTTAHWHDPIKTTYGGCDIYEQALPSQGIILLESLNIAENFPLADWGLTHPDYMHVLLEATKMGFADSRRYGADPEVESVPVEQLLSKEYARRRAGEIDLKRAQNMLPGVLNTDTTEFVVGDDDMAIAFIQSVFAVWGARFVIPGTGILMNNRLRGFSLDPSSPNVIAGGKRTTHTLNTFLCLRDGELVIGGGTPGADYQVQCNLQTVVGALTLGYDLQSAIDAPRWVNLAEGDVGIEARFPAASIEELANRGHKIRMLAPWQATLSKSQVIASLPGPSGWAVGSDLRGEGLGLGW